MINIQDYEAKQASRDCITKQMQAAFPHLVASAGGSLIAAAKNIRIELKRAFPGVKFSVRSSRFSGGDAIDVKWTDGPTSAQVDQIINKYKAGSFDGMTDCYNYSRSSWTDAFGSSKYVMSQRHYSDKAIAAAIRIARARYHLQPQFTVAQYRAGDGIAEFDGIAWQQTINRQLSKLTWAISHEPLKSAA